MAAIPGRFLAIFAEVWLGAADVVRRMARVLARRTGRTSGWARRMGSVQSCLAPRVIAMKALVETSPLYTSRAGVARYVQGLLYGLRLTSAEEPEIAELAWPVENFAYRQPVR